MYAVPLGELRRTREAASFPRGYFVGKTREIFRGPFSSNVQSLVINYSVKVNSLGSCLFISIYVRIFRFVLLKANFIRYFIPLQVYTRVSASSSTFSKICRLIISFEV